MPCAVSPTKPDVLLAKEGVDDAMPPPGVMRADKAPTPLRSAAAALSVCPQQCVPGWNTRRQCRCHLRSNAVTVSAPMGLE